MDDVTTSTPGAEWTEAKVASIVDDLARFGVFTKRGPLTFTVPNDLVEKFKKIVATLNSRTAETLGAEVRGGRLDPDDAVDALDSSAWDIPYMACTLLLSDYCKIDTSTPEGKELFADYVLFCHMFLMRMARNLEPQPRYVK